MSRPFLHAAMPKRPKMCRSSSSLSHFLFPRDFSGTIADRDIVNTPLELFRSIDVPFGGHKTEPVRLGRIAAAKSIFFRCSRTT